MASNDDPFDLENAWADLRPKVSFEPPVVAKAVPGRAWLGVGYDEHECSYPGYARIGIALALDGTNMTAHFDVMESGLKVNWVGLWFRPTGGEPFYRKELYVTQVKPGDSLSVQLSINDESGLVTSVLRSLELL